MSRNAIYVLVGLVTLAIIVTVIYTYSRPKETPKPPQNTVLLENYSFNPNELRVGVGTEVAFRNDDKVVHGVVSDTGIFSSGEIQPGQEYKFTFNDPGEFEYHESTQPTVTGKIVVE